MSETQGLIFVVLAAIFEMFITMIYCGSVLKDRREFLTPPLYFLACVGLSVLFWAIRLPGLGWAFYLLISFMQLLAFTLLYETKWTVRLFSTVSYLVFSMISEVAANSIIILAHSFGSRSSERDLYLYTVMLSKLIKFIFVLIVHAAISKKSVITDSKNYLCLIAVPLISVFVIVAVTIGPDGETASHSLATNTAISGILIILNCLLST